MGASTALRVRLFTVLDRVVTTLDVEARGGFDSVGVFIRRVAERVTTGMVGCVWDACFDERWGRAKG